MKSRLFIFVFAVLFSLSVYGVYAVTSGTAPAITPSQPWDTGADPINLGVDAGDPLTSAKWNALVNKIEESASTLASTLASTSATFDIQIVTNNCGDTSPCYATCPAGYLALGGGYRDGSGNDDDTDGDYPFSTTQWSCDDEGSTVCYVICGSGLPTGAPATSAPAVISCPLCGTCWNTRINGSTCISGCNRAYHKEICTPDGYIYTGDEVEGVLGDCGC